MAAIPAPASFVWRWCRTVKQPPRRGAGWSRFWIDDDDFGIAAYHGLRLPQRKRARSLLAVRASTCSRLQSQGPMSMPAIERVIPLDGHLPATIRDVVARRVRDLAVLGLLSTSGVVASPLMTWSVQDPSLSHATSRAIRNIMGYPGAIGADLLMQILGLGAIMLILPVAIWGWRMLTHRTFDREALRLACWILCTVISAGFASCWPHGGAWPLPTGLGGVVGDALLRTPAVVFGPPGLVYRLALGTLLGAAMIATFLTASGIGSRPQADALTEVEDDDAPFVEEEDDSGSVSLGRAFHAAMSAK